MQFDAIGLATLAYVLVMAVLFVRHFKQASKQYLSTMISGLVLLGYSVILRAGSDLQTNWFVLVLAVAMIQLSGFEVGRNSQGINWVRQGLLLVIHALILYFMLVA